MYILSYSINGLLHLLEAPHAVQNVELLPAFGEVDLPINVVWVPEVNKGQILQNKTPARQKSVVKLWQPKNKPVHVFMDSQVRDAWRLHFSQSSSVRSEGGGTVNQRAIFFQSLRRKRNISD